MVVAATVAGRMAASVRPTGAPSRRSRLCLARRGSSRRSGVTARSRFRSRRRGVGGGHGLGGGATGARRLRQIGGPRPIIWMVSVAIHRRGALVRRPAVRLLMTSLFASLGGCCLGVHVARVLMGGRLRRSLRGRDGIGRDGEVLSAQARARAAPAPRRCAARLGTARACSWRRRPEVVAVGQRGRGTVVVLSSSVASRRAVGARGRNDALCCGRLGDDAVRRARRSSRSVLRRRRTAGRRARPRTRMLGCR